MDERKPIILGLIILVSIVVVWSHWEKHHFKIAKRTSYYLIWIVTIAPFSPLAIKELLVVWHPVALTAIISAITTLLLAPIYLKYAPRTSPKAFLTLLVISIFNGLATIFYYFSYQVSGIVLTMLLFSLQPILVYFASVFSQRTPALEKIIRFHNNFNIHRHHPNYGASINMLYLRIWKSEKF